MERQDIRIGGTGAEAALARSTVERLMSDATPAYSAAVIEDAKLLTTELVTNGILHGGLGRGDVIGLGIDAGPTSVRLEVTDAGPGFDLADVRRRWRDDERGHWGLVLVNAISDRWGVMDGGSTTVWFELDR